MYILSFTRGEFTSYVQLTGSVLAERNLTNFPLFGPRRCEFYPAPARQSNQVLVPEERFWRPIFLRPKSLILVKRRGKSMKQKFIEMGCSEVLCRFHTFQPVIV